MAGGHPDLIAHRREHRLRVGGLGDGATEADVDGTGANRVGRCGGFLHGGDHAVAARRFREARQP